MYGMVTSVVMLASMAIAWCTRVADAETTVRGVLTALLTVVAALVTFTALWREAQPGLLLSRAVVIAAYFREGLVGLTSQEGLLGLSRPIGVNLH